MNTKNIIIAIIVILLIIMGWSFLNEVDQNEIRIGVVTPLTGDVAFWGESTRIGMRLVEKELSEQGKSVRFHIEDGGLDPQKALSAAQKLVNVNQVDAIYSEFVPASHSITSFVKDRPIIHLYNSADVSPLEEGDNIFKTYIDYEANCREVAKRLKEEGVERMGMLKMNTEFAELCSDGVASIYEDNDFFETSYNPGETDLRTPILKLKNDNVEAVFNPGFPAEVFASLRQMRELGMTEVIFVSNTDGLVPSLVEEHSSIMDPSISFGLPPVSAALEEQAKKELDINSVPDRNALGQAYVHLHQLASALLECDKEISCVREHIAESGESPAIGFMGFEDRIARFEFSFMKWQEGEFRNWDK